VYRGFSCTEVGSRIFDRFKCFERASSIVIEVGRLPGDRAARKL
jgi:hypothetical protein